VPEGTLLGVTAELWANREIRDVVARVGNLEQVISRMDGRLEELAGIVHALLPPRAA